MKTMKNIILAIIMLLCESRTQHCKASTQPIKKLGSAFCNAIVSESQANLYFPILDPEDSQPYKWNRDATIINSLEYEWSVSVATSSSSFMVGAFLFRHPSAKPSSGTLEQLIQAMQHSVYRHKYTLGPRTLAEDMIIHVGTEDGGVFVYIEDKATLKTLFAEKPSTADFNVTMPDEGDSFSCTSQIQYK